MKLIVGLGNYGSQYEITRHNAGWIALDQLIEKYGYTQQKNDHNSIIFFSTINNEKVLFVKPQTYMNNSGTAIQEIMHYYKIDIKDLVVLHDEKDFPVGKNQFKMNGSAAGHNGIKSVIQHLGTQNFNRYRIGIGQPEDGWKIIDWVMSRFKSEELAEIIQSSKKISDFINDWTNDTTFQNIMNKYNS
ncbi:Peptidyl-tRNA hydrolase [Mesoplasma florum W37]|uniref:Peptidyl-tRNA hydrolase n=1 Tax=Mesoplasma florum TaxID=2151 RepID=A0AAD0MPJ1_MESFO|nr:aminoacyl-tRNA hydrolase [Mesoplasma florum]AGY41148.1 Peptidyl-tRNA hydrolase [Mesoplasma florum W37]AVN59379.1 aminoacyl-tRNA hydrolase [Mesoplasma florum]AVN65486.1 Peptidyl-tRNA hydrolase [Mesoplasma florum]